MEEPGERHGHGVVDNSLHAWSFRIIFLLLALSMVQMGGLVLGGIFAAMLIAIELADVIIRKRESAKGSDTPPPNPLKGA